MKKIAILLFLLFLPVAVFAQETDAKIPTDIFQFAPDVRITEPVSRDLIAVGGKVEIADNVAQDLFALAGTIEIISDVAGDVRVAGTRVIINSNIGGNLAILAQTVEIQSNAVIAGSAKIRAENVLIDGKIMSDAQIDAYNLEQNGTIAGELVYEKIETKKSKQSSFGWFFRLIGLFGMLVVGLLFVSIWPKAVRKSISGSIKNPIKDFIYGVIALIAGPIVVLVLLLTVIGIPLGLILLASYLIALYLAQIFVGIILGTYIIGAFKGREKASKSSLLITMVTGIIVLWLICGIPGAGGLLKLIAIIWGLGVLVNLEIKAFKKLES